jgi:hypothetical protein
MTPALLEDLAQQIREGVIEEFAQRLLASLRFELAVPLRPLPTPVGDNFAIEMGQIWVELRAFDYEHDVNGDAIALFRQGEVSAVKTNQEGKVLSAVLRLDRGTTKVKTVSAKELRRDWAPVMKG